MRRREAGLTQQQLADLAQLSERTIRDLEAGSTPRPRGDSLKRIVSALGLDPGARLDFLSIWGAEDHSESAAVDAIYVDRVPGSLGLGAVVRARTADLDSLAWLSQVTVGPDRRIQSRHTEMVVVARKDGVTGRVHIAEPTSSVQLDLIDIDLTEGCTVQRSRTLPHLGVKVFDLSFGKTLVRGDTHAFSYRVDFQQATRAASHQVKRHSVDLTGDGFYRTVPLYSLRVLFEPDDVPTQCAQIFRARPGAQIIERGGVAVSSWPDAQLTLQDAKPGNHGLRWTW